MSAPSLFEDCQAWIVKGHESWKMYFSKWETFAKYEENITEIDLVCKPRDRQKKRKNGNKKMLKQPLSQKRLKISLLKNHQKRQKKLIKKKKSKAEINNTILFRRPSNENLSEIIENRQLEVTLTTVFTDFLKANTNMCEMFSVLFQTFPGNETTIKESSYLLPRQQASPFNEIKMNVANLSVENQKALCPSMWKNSSLDRSICPARNVYLQTLNENFKEIQFKQIQSKWEQWGNLRSLDTIESIGPQDTNSSSACHFKSNFSNHQFLTLGVSQTKNLEPKNSSPLRPAMFRFTNSGVKNVQLGPSPKFPSAQNRELIGNIIVSKIKITQEGKGLGNSCLAHITNDLILNKDNADFICTPQKSSQRKCLNKMVSQGLTFHSQQSKLIFDRKSDDSDSDDQTVYRSPRIHSLKKKLKIGKSDSQAGESDTDECESIFDRIKKS